MAVPKKRTGKSAQGHRRSNWKATKPEVTNCSKCNAIIPTHTVCPECGYYKGKAVSIKHADFAKEEVKTEKAAKKPAKAKVEKAKKVEEKVETETVVEAEVIETEVKSEEVVEEKAPEEKSEKPTDEE